MLQVEPPSFFSNETRAQVNFQPDVTSLLLDDSDTKIWLNAQVAIKTVNISTSRCCFAEGGTEFFISGYRTESTLIFPPTNQILNLWPCRYRFCR